MPHPIPSAGHPPPPPPPWPNLTHTPVTHQHSCLALSLSLIAYLARAIQGQHQHQTQQQSQDQQPQQQHKRDTATSVQEARDSSKLEVRMRRRGGRGSRRRHDVRKGIEDDRLVLVLSVGSGTGLVEALLSAALDADGCGFVMGVEDQGRQEWIVNLANEDVDAAPGDVAGAPGKGGGNGDQHRDQCRDRHAARQTQAAPRTRGKARGRVRSSARVYGVEVPSTYSELNRYLPAERRVVVRGVWDVLGAGDVRELWREPRDEVDEGEEAEEGPEGLEVADDEEREDGADNGDSEEARGLCGDDTSAPTGCEDTGHDVGVEDMGIDTGPRLDVDTSVWLMFIYPRQASLVEKYLDAWLDDCCERDTLEGHDHTTQPTRATSMRLAGLIWAGPRADWEDYEPIFTRLRQRGWGVVEAWGEEAGVREGEGVVVARGG